MCVQNKLLMRLLRRKQPRNIADRSLRKASAKTKLGDEGVDKDEFLRKRYLSLLRTGTPHDILEETELDDEEITVADPTAPFPAVLLHMPNAKLEQALNGVSSRVRSILSEKKALDEQREADLEEEIRQKDLQKVQDEHDLRHFIHDLREGLWQLKHLA